MTPNVSKSIIKSVKSLDTHKGRKKEHAFKAEGTKCVLDTLGFFDLKALYASEEWIKENPVKDVDRVVVCKRSELIEMSSLSTASNVIAVYDIPDYDFKDIRGTENLILALDTIQDPGNLGTIIRLADWFGISDIICSLETADCFSPKVIQATMGSISRVKVYYGSLPEMIDSLSVKNIYGTFLDGESISDCKLDNNGIIIIGNEGNGISEDVAKKVTKKLHIPSYPPGEERGESLNAAIATAISVAKFRGV